MKKGLIITLISISAFASNGLEIGIGGGYMKVDHTNQTQNYGLEQIRIGKSLKNSNFIRLDISHSSKAKIIESTINVGHNFKNKTKLTPYMFAGIGVQKNNKIHSSSRILSIGIGAKYKVTKKADIFLEAKASKVNNTHSKHYGIIAGVDYAIGNLNFGINDKDHDGVADNIDKCPNTPKDIMVDKNGCPLDNDKDGVPNYLDKCPATPNGVKVDKNGCPLDDDKDGVPNFWDECPNTPKGVKINASGCPIVKDSDSDGIPDNIDKCPRTPIGVKVDSNGCAIDSDKDGIPDYLDECPNTKKNVVVNATGCPLTYNFNVHFRSGDAKLTLRNIEGIVKFAKFLKANPEYSAKIEGYTDNTGPEDYNVELSEKRARAVYEALIKLGVSPKRLSYKGYGSANPIASNNTEEGKRLNRRVVAKLFFNEKQ